MDCAEATTPSARASASAFCAPADAVDAYHAAIARTGSKCACSSAAIRASERAAQQAKKMMAARPAMRVAGRRVDRTAFAIEKEDVVGLGGFKRFWSPLISTTRGLAVGRTSLCVSCSRVRLRRDSGDRASLTRFKQKRL